MRRLIAQAQAMPEVCKKFDELGREPVGNTPAEFTASRGLKKVRAERLHD